MDPMARRWHTVQDVAERYGVSTMTVANWIAAGHIAAVNVARATATQGARWRISEESLNAFEAARAGVQPVRRTRRKKARPANVVKFY
jgi:excisionase family DNA binding protein